ncbi:MAG: glycoside hydrolase family 3 protein [Proteobacteria bacterium]|nr:glycoside hydrolase family 3 protein [Pseudomonadota bacterium]
MNSSNISSAGDHFLIGLRPTVQLHERDRALLADLRPAGVVLFKSNFQHDQPYEVWLKAHRKLIDDVRDAIRRERIFIGIDHEGGRVCRTPAPITRFSFAARWAGQAAAVGRAMGVELASLGVNLNFAPVLDIHSNPANPVIGARAFGTTGEQVTAAALAFMKALQAEKVLACGKHFPGHGDTATDSHRELPILDRDLEGLRARELRPFRAAVEAGIPMMMTSHLLLPKLDPGEPVTLSRKFGQEILRGELGFKGVVVSDDIGMHAVSRMFDDPGAAVRLLLAGTDLMMVCSYFTDTDRCRGFAQSMLAAQQQGILSPEAAAQSRERVRALLERAPQNPVSVLGEDVFATNRSAGMLFTAETAEVI